MCGGGGLIKQVTMQFFQGWPLEAVLAFDPAIGRGCLHRANAFELRERVIQTGADELGSENVLVEF